MVESSALILDPIIQSGYPEMWETVSNTLRMRMGDIPSMVVSPDVYSDRTPKMWVNSDDKSIAVSLGFISGVSAEGNLSEMTKAGFTLRFKHPNDPRTPRVESIHYVFSDFEGRGNKPTLDKDGNYIPEAELHYAYYLAETLANIGKANKATILDPHDHILHGYLEGLGVEVDTITALREIALQLKEKNMLPSAQDGGIVIPDNGAIGRSMFFSMVTGIPIIGRIDKKRIRGVAEINKIYGADTIKGKSIIIVDDMIATGGTLFTDGKALKKLGAESLMAIVTHTKGIDGAGEKVASKLNGGEEKILDKIIITDSTPYHKDFKGIPNVETISVMGLMTLAVEAALKGKGSDADTMLQEHRFRPMSHDQSLRELKNLYPYLVSDDELIKDVIPQP